MRRNWPRDMRVETAITTLYGEAKAIGRGVVDGEWWKLSAHMRAWHAMVHDLNAPSSPYLYADDCPYWPLVQTSPLFFPGVPLPEKGWYDAVDHDGAMYKPISTHATYDSPGGVLRVRAANCYPELGSAEVRFIHDGNEITSLTVTDSNEQSIDFPQGSIDIETDTCFYAEDTGQPMDIGGWLSIAPAE